MAGEFTQVGVEAIVKGIAKFNKDLTGMNKAIQQSGKNSKQAVAASAKFNSTLSSMATGGLALVTRALVDFGKAVVKEGMAFQKEMSNVGAVSGAVGKDFEALEKQAVKLGSTTKFTAIEAAEGMSFLAMAGFETNEIIGAMPGTLNLAAASNLDLAQSADIVSNVLQGFGAQAEQTDHFVDVLSKTFTTSNTSLQQLGAGMKFAAPVAKSLGLTVEDTAAAMGVLGNAGIQGSLAGTTLRGVLLSLASPTKAAQATMDELGISIFDAQGNMLPMPQIIGNINKATAGMTQEQRNATLQTLVGARRLAGFNVLLAEGEDGLQSYGDELRDSVGTASDIASKQLDNLAGDMTLLQSALSGFKISSFELLEPVLRSTAQAATELIKDLQKGADVWKGIFGTLSDHVAANEQLHLERAAANGVTEAIEKLAKQKEEEAAASLEAADASIVLADANEQVVDTLEEEESAWSKTDELVSKYGITVRHTSDQAVASLEKRSAAAKKAAAEETKAYEDAMKAQQEMLSTLATDTAGYYTSLREVQNEQAASEQAFNDQMASIRSEGGEKAKAAQASLSDELAKIEAERQEKIAWVRTGAWNRTQEQEAIEEAFWNQSFDERVSLTEQKYSEQAAAVEAGLAQQQAAAQAARDRELAEQQAHLEELKLNAALATLETTGQLAQFTGGLAVSAAEAAELIRAGVLPVTNELGVAIQGALGQLQTQEAATAQQAQTNQGVLQDALDGTLQSTQNLEAGIINLASPFATLANETAPVTQEAMGLMFENLTLTTDTFTQGPAAMMDQQFMNFSAVTLPQTQTVYNTSFQAMSNTTQNLIGVVLNLIQTIAQIGVTARTSVDEAIDAFEDFEDAVKDAAEGIDDDLLPVIRELNSLLQETINKAKTAGGDLAALSGGLGASDGAGMSGGAGLDRGIGLSNGLGLGWEVPPGYPNDSFGPLFVESGEEVLVTPRGTSIDNVVMDRLMSDGLVNASMTVNNFEMNVSTVASPQAVIQQYEVAQALIQQ